MNLRSLYEIIFFPSFKINYFNAYFLMDWILFLLLNKDLDIAIVKATNHVESPPKERHVSSEFVEIFILLIDITPLHLLHH